jgi:hypothetical protein
MGIRYFATKISENMAETPEGFLLCLGVPIARTGEMDYGKGESPIEVGPDGRARVSRDAKEVFRPETIASFEGKPFTIKHPEDFVNPTNWKLLAKGGIQNVRRGDNENANDLLADILVTDAEAIALIKKGVREVSCGYEAEYVQLGVGRGMQTNIVGNHLALVEQGRAGAAYAINDQKGAKMAKISEKIKGIFAKAADEATKVVDEAAGDDKTKTGDEMPKWGKDLQKQMKLVTDALTQVASMSQPSKLGDEDKEDDKSKDEDPDKEKKSADEAPAWAQDMVKCMNAIMEKLSGKAGDEEEEESEDEDPDMMEDDDFEETPAASPAGDTAARIEILAPGMKFKGKDAKKQALEHAYKAKDHKMLIDGLNGGKALDFDKKMKAETIDHLFIGASEMIKLARTKDFSRSRAGVRDTASQIEGSEPVSAEKMNEINAKFYAEKGVH